MEYDAWVNENLDKLKKGDFIWAMSECNLFKTYNRSYGDKSETYLGPSYGDPDADYDDSFYVLQMAAVPKVYKPVKMFFCGKMCNSEIRNDMLYVFTTDIEAAQHGNFSFGQHIVVRPYVSWRGWHDMTFLSHDIGFNHKKVVDPKNVFFTEEACVEACQKKNASHCSNMLKLINKTINSMKAQLKSFMSSELYIDHKKEIEDDLKVCK